MFSKASEWIGGFFLDLGADMFHGSWKTMNNLLLSPAFFNADTMKQTNETLYNVYTVIYNLGWFIAFGLAVYYIFVGYAAERNGYESPSILASFFRVGSSAFIIPLMTGMFEFANFVNNTIVSIVVKGGASADFIEKAVNQSGVGGIGAALASLFISFGVLLIAIISSVRYILIVILFILAPIAAAIRISNPILFDRYVKISFAVIFVQSIQVFLMWFVSVVLLSTPVEQQNLFMVFAMLLCIIAVPLAPLFMSYSKGKTIIRAMK